MMSNYKIFKNSKLYKSQKLKDIYFYSFLLAEEYIFRNQVYVLYRDFLKNINLTDKNNIKRIQELLIEYSGDTLYNFRPKSINDNLTYRQVSNFIDYCVNNLDYFNSYSKDFNYEIINKIFSFAYMGAAEFEFGNVAESFKKFLQYKKFYYPHLEIRGLNYLQGQNRKVGMYSEMKYRRLYGI